MFNIALVVAVVLIVFLILIKLLKSAKAKNVASKSTTILTKKRNILSKREKPMFEQLRKAFPDEIILAQVSFSALIEAGDRSTRNRFDRKYADFVICNSEFEGIAVIELDDSTHANREKQDEFRASLLKAAGYRVFRYRSVPEIAKLQSDITPTARNEPGIVGRETA